MCISGHLMQVPTLFWQIIFSVNLSPISHVGEKTPIIPRRVSFQLKLIGRVILGFWKLTLEGHISDKNISPEAFPLVSVMFLFANAYEVLGDSQNILHLASKIFLTCVSSNLFGRHIFFLNHLYHYFLKFYTYVYIYRILIPISIKWQSQIF